MEDDAFCDFLHNATMTVSGLWTEAGGVELDSDELGDLNDLLEAFFCDRERNQ